jgi:hypothetical protein
MNNQYQYQTETLQASEKLYQVGPKSIASHEQKLGLKEHEPLIVILDSCIRYAKAYQSRYEIPVASDYILGPALQQILHGVQTLLDGCGAVSLESNQYQDSKDNGVCSTLVQTCLALAGYTTEYHDL